MNRRQSVRSPALPRRPQGNESLGELEPASRFGMALRHRLASGAGSECGRSLGRRVHRVLRAVAPFDLSRSD